MKKWQQRLLLFAGMGLFILLLISQSNKNTPYKRRLREEYIVPLVQAQLYGVVVNVRRTDLDLENMLYGRRSLQFEYLDIETNTRGRYETGLDEPIEIGDTIVKQQGENRFTLIKKNKFYRSDPIDVEQQ